MQWLQWLVQHLHTVRQNLADNIETINGLQEYGETLLSWKSHSSKPDNSIDETHTEFLNWIRLWRDEIKSIVSESEVLIKQVQECGELVGVYHFCAPSTILLRLTCILDNTGLQHHKNQRHGDRPPTWGDVESHDSKRPRRRSPDLGPNDEIPAHCAFHAGANAYHLDISAPILSRGM
jgi:hypothetical protein